MKLNLGCWHRYIPGFIHVDLCDMPHIDHISNIDNLPFISDESVDLIYVSHAFEYFDLHHASKVLSEWRRVLKKGGVLRMSVPDFDQLLKIYEESNDINKILGPLYGRMEIKTEEGSALLFHKTVYNFESLSSLLSSNGFINVKRYRWQETIHKDYDDHSQAYYPHMDKENGIMVSLNIEASKK